MDHLKQTNDRKQNNKVEIIHTDTRVVYNLFETLLFETYCKNIFC